MINNRIQDLEDILGVTVLAPVDRGESLEKYKVTIEGKNAMLRIYEGSYYGNRFLREGLALRYLEHKPASFIVPKIVEEWPEYASRAIEWIDLISAPHTQDISDIVADLKRFTDFTTPFSLEQDLRDHLYTTEVLHQAYRSSFLESVDDIIKRVDFNDSEHTLVHGDFHKGNLGVDPHNQTVLFDWEFASKGSSSYDLAYFGMMGRKDKLDDPSAWDALVIAVISHWYLRDKHFSPKQAIHWFERLKEVTDLI